jgi:plasmid segregation protein ParM
MNNDIIGKVGALHDMKVEDDHISSVIQGQETILPDGVIKTIRESAAKHSDMILDKLRELQVDLRSNPAIFIGGGAMLFKNFIESSRMVVKADFIPDPKANAIGYIMLAAAQLQKLSANGGHSEIV